MEPRQNSGCHMSGLSIPCISKNAGYADDNLQPDTVAESVNGRCIHAAASRILISSSSERMGDRMG